MGYFYSPGGYEYFGSNEESCVLCEKKKNFVALKIKYQQNVNCENPDKTEPNLETKTLTILPGNITIRQLNEESGVWRKEGRGRDERKTRTNTYTYHIRSPTPSSLTTNIASKHFYLRSFP